MEILRKRPQTRCFWKAYIFMSVQKNFNPKQITSTKSIKEYKRVNFECFSLP